MLILVTCMNFIIRCQYTLLNTVGNQYAVTPKYFNFYSPVVDFPLTPAESFYLQQVSFTVPFFSSFISEFQFIGEL